MRLSGDFCALATEFSVTSHHGQAPDMGGAIDFAFVPLRWLGGGANELICLLCLLSSRKAVH